MEDSNDFLSRTRALREALKQKAAEVENNTLSETTSSLLESQILKNIQSSVQFYKSNPQESRNVSYSLKSLMERKVPLKSNREVHKKEPDPFILPAIRKIYLPYLIKPAEFPLPLHKKIKRFKVSFTGIEPKIKKLNKAYSALTSRANL